MPSMAERQFVSGSVHRSLDIAATAKKGLDG
jgi:hypothetical protein